MQFRHILETLKNQYQIQIIMEENTDKITDIRLLDTGDTNFEQGVLYIGDIATDTTLTSIPSQLITFKRPEITNDSQNLALIERKDFTSFFNQAQRLFYQSLQLSNDFSQLIAMSIRGDSAQAVVNSASEKLKNPIIIIDTGFKVLFYSEKYQITDALWKKNIERGYCTYEFITAVNQILANTSAPDDSTAYILRCPQSPHSKLCSKIFWNSSLIGYTVMLEEKTPLNLMHHEMLPNISYVMSDILSKNPDFGGIHGSLKSILLYQLLENNNFETISIRLKASKIDIPKRMCCLLASPSTPGNRKQWESFAQDQLKIIFPTAFLCPYKGFLVALLTLKDNKELSESEEKKLNSLLPKVFRTIYISQIYSDILKSRKHFDQCLSLDQIAIRLDLSDQLLYYNSYLFYNLLSHCIEAETLSDFVSPILRILKSYDIKNGTNLYDTLKMYITCQYNSTKTAQALFIHRNSLAYRMEKIEELTSIDFNDSNQLFQIASSYYIERYLS